MGHQSLPLFVIQQHAASRLHYDVRLAVGDALVSWAVPKGPSTDPADKRLAIQTPDHPLWYAKFEGIITPGNYGAGTVMVWDIGTYRNLKESDGLSMHRCLEKGLIEVWLDGKKLQGGFVFIYIRKPNVWLMKKMDDDYAFTPKDPIKNLTRSALSNRTLEEIAAHPAQILPTQ